MNKTPFITQVAGVYSSRRYLTFSEIQATLPKEAKEALKQIHPHVRCSGRFNVEGGYLSISFRKRKYLYSDGWQLVYS